MKAVLTKDEHGALGSDELKKLYAEKNGKFVLIIEGIEEHEGAVALKSALDAERKNASTAAAQLAELRKQVEGIDPVKAREALDKIKELERANEEGDIPKQFAAQFEKAVSARVKSMEADWQKKEESYKKKIGDMETQTKTLGEQLEEVTIADAVRAEAQAAGLHDWAVEDAVMHARKLYKLVDGKPVPKDEQGQVVYGKEAGKPKPIKEWMSDMVATKTGWVKDSAGGGGSNNGREHGLGTKVGNVMKVARAVARDPQAYGKVKAEAAKTGATIEITD